MQEKHHPTVLREYTAKERLTALLYEIGESKRLFRPDNQPRPEWKLSKGRSWIAGRDAAAVAANASIAEVIRVADESVIHGIQLRYGKRYEGKSNEALKTILFNSGYNLALEKVDAMLEANRPSLSLELGLVHIIGKTFNDRVGTIRRERYADSVDGVMIKGMIDDALLLSKYLAISDLHPPHVLGGGHGVLVGGPLSALEAHAANRWEVWKKGYGLLCDVDGVLQVFSNTLPAA